MKIHARIDDDETLCGIPILYTFRMGIKIPIKIIALDTAISGNAPAVTCKRCMKIMYR